MRHRAPGHRSYPRTARVNEVLREVIAEELERRADADERLRLLTVTAVVTDPDMRHAIVYMSSISPSAAAALGDVRVRLQAAIGRQAHLKRTPALQFATDPGVAEGERVDEILRALQRGTDAGEQRPPASGGAEDHGAAGPG